VSQSGSAPLVLLAAGGTGGHLFPGLAVAELLRAGNCRVSLLVSPKEVDQEAVKSVSGMEIATLPAIGLSRGQSLAFLAGFIRSYRASHKLFCTSPPNAVLAMGGFTSAPPLLAGKRLGARVFLHESNSIPGRANRWLSWFVDHAFISFPSAASRLHASQVSVCGTPVRNVFRSLDAGACRAALGLDPERPTVLVMGGSQGATGINSLVLDTLSSLGQSLPQLQWIHVAGSQDVAWVRAKYEELRLRAAVHPFFARMELALGAATVAVSRAGASSLAELAALRLPSVLIPYPAATDNHQFHNARAYEQSGAALLLEQSGATSRQLHDLISSLCADDARRNAMAGAIGDQSRVSLLRKSLEPFL
jgi:UDP-N-acetylglucosamine--N-acetylmuramyl-(pentapeptide) pyrophosphoryl-undecaprenol N-acetylglucosamine transferase